MPTYEEIRFVLNQDSVTCRILLKPIISDTVAHAWHEKEFVNGSIPGIIEAIRCGREVPSDWPVISTIVIKD